MSSPPVIAAIALGSNLGDRAAHLRAAVRALALTPGVEVLRVSTLIETDPVGPGDQGRYLNGAVLVRAALDATALLAGLQTIERAHGRDRTRTRRWGPRTLDLDLILFGDQIIDHPGLHVPHPRLTRRLFVLTPLAEIGADLTVPTTGKTIAKTRDDAMRAEQDPGTIAPGSG